MNNEVNTDNALIETPPARKCWRSPKVLDLGLIQELVQSADRGPSSDNGAPTTVFDGCGAS
jgi:hypothetical protein